MTFLDGKGVCLILIGKKKIESHYFFYRISRFFFMGLQIFLYRGLAGLEQGELVLFVIVFFDLHDGGLACLNFPICKSFLRIRFWYQLPFALS